MDGLKPDRWVKLQIMVDEIIDGETDKWMDGWMVEEWVEDGRIDQTEL